MNNVILSLILDTLVGESSGIPTLNFDEGTTTNLPHLHNPESNMAKFVPKDSENILISECTKRH